MSNFWGSYHCTAFFIIIFNAVSVKYIIVKIFLINYKYFKIWLKQSFELFYSGLYPCFSKFFGQNDKNIFEKFTFCS